MNKISSDHEIGKQPKRKDIIKRFVERLNHDRIYHKMKPLRPAYFAIRMSHLDIFTLEGFYKDCERADNFSKAWWGRLKVK